MHFSPPLYGPPPHSVPPPIPSDDVSTVHDVLARMEGMRYYLTLQSQMAYRRQEAIESSQSALHQMLLDVLMGRRYTFEAEAPRLALTPATQIRFPYIRQRGDTEWSWHREPFFGDPVDDPTFISPAP